MTSRAAEQFARVIVEMAPYAHEIVFVGGWVHALYLAEANETGAIRTDDVDITIPHVLLTADRPTLLELAERAGFERDPISDLEGAAVMMACPAPTSRHGGVRRDTGTASALSDGAQTLEGRAGRGPDHSSHDAQCL